MGILHNDAIAVEEKRRAADKISGRNLAPDAVVRVHRITLGRHAGDHCNIERSTSAQIA